MSDFESVKNKECIGGNLCVFYIFLKDILDNTSHKMTYQHNF